MNEEDILITQANLQKKWEEEFHHLFMLVRGKFRPGTLVTICARLPDSGEEGDFAWTMEDQTDNLRKFLDRLDERNKKREVNKPLIDVSPTTQIISPKGFKANGNGNF